MEVLQCDGCDFRAESYDDLKAHIQDVHTAFLQPTAVSDSFSHMEDEEDLAPLNCEYGSPSEQSGQHSFDSGHFSDSNQIKYTLSANMLTKPANHFFQCKFCVRYFRSKALLNEHTRKVHGILGGTSLSDRCSPGSQTSKQSNYRIPMHDGFGKVFSCQYCTYKSPRRARILKHQKMYHKGSMLSSSASPPENVTESCSSEMPSEELCSDLPGEVVDRSVLESMVKPLTKSRGNFSCEWCSYQTFRRERWCDHMMKKHRNMVKIMSAVHQHQEEGESAGSLRSDSPSSPRSTTNSNILSDSLNGNENSSVNRGASGNTVLNLTSGQTNKISCYQYSQAKSKVPNSTASSVLSERSTFVMSDISNSDMDIDTNITVNDSQSSSDDELVDLDDANTTSSVLNEDSAKLLLSEEDNKMLETKGIPFRRYMNRFQCPFCSFLTMHRRSISRHIENIHLSGKTTVYKCDECPFICTSLLKLGTHKQFHIEGSPDWDHVDLQNESPDVQQEVSEPVNGESVITKINGKNTGNEVNQQNPHRCTLCTFSTTTLKGLRVHQQHKHSYCDNMHTSNLEASLNEQQDSESETNNSSNFVQKTQTSILGFSSKKHSVNKSARKSINDLPLDLSPAKKRTRIDEIANNLQSRICQSKQLEDTVINLEEIYDGEEEDENNAETGVCEGTESAQTEQGNHYQKQKIYMNESVDSQRDSIMAPRKHSLQSKFSSRHIPAQVIISDDEENENDIGVSTESKTLQDRGSQDSRDAFQDNLDYSEDAGMLFYCKHCEYHNKSARSVSTHYQRMHPYIKFSFRYILDPEDQSAVFRCLECYVEYTNFDELNQHYMDHHPEAINVLNFNQSDLVYRCRFCSYTSPNVRSLMPHYQRMHPTVKINNAMIFSSYVVEQSQKGAESQTLREILNSGPKSFCTSTSVYTSSVQSSPVHRSLSKMQESNTEAEGLKETMDNSIVVYDCDICSFASPNVHSVLVHYQKKHPEQKASYFRIQKTMRLISMDRCQTSTNKSYGLNVPNISKNSSLVPFEVDEEIYYCKHCVYSNRSVVGVLVHYQKRHPEIKVTAKYIKHAPPSPGLMKLMDELQIAPPKQFLNQFSNGIDVSSASYPGPGGDKGEVEMLFFCQHCDYGNRTVKGVLIHYQKKHKDVKANADLVRKHTAVVRSQRERAQMVQSGNMSGIPSTYDLDKTKALRSLKCRHCSYTSPYVYALKKHLKKDHPTVKATAMTILHWAYEDGILEAGYHCEWCIYSHAEPSGLLMHYQRRHPEHNVDYTYMASKLWAGPNATSSQQVENLDSKLYQCRDCAFEACSIWDITNHYQAVHPWVIKGNDSVLLDIIRGNQTAEQMRSPTDKGPVTGSSPYNNNHLVHDEESFDITGQSAEVVPQLSFASTSISNNPYQCTVCLSEYNSLHGLLTHYGKKHPGMKVKAADFAQEADINPGSVYKCRHCPYVNSRIHGVLTHYQKRHPLVKVTAEDFADDIEQVIDINEGEEKSKSQRQGYGAYRCKMCPYTHGTLEKLKIHYEKYHNQPASDMFAPSLVNINKDDTVAECSSTSVDEVQDITDFQLALAEFPIDKGEKHAVFKCQLCKYFCSTRKGIARHYRIKHNNVRAQPEGKNNVFKCALCSYTNPIRKGLAAHYQKRHDIDAYYTHCLAASKTFGEKPNKVVVPVSSQASGPILSEELRLAVERRKCSICTFQTFSKKSIISHYIKRHPGVFPKRQHSSKLGRYFTVVFAQEPEKQIPVEKENHTEEKLEEEVEGDMEWLPFKCLKCFKLSFNTAELLCMHYTDYHSQKFKRDFTTLLGPTQEEGTECYECSHCELKFLALQELSTHLTNHNEEFQKRVIREERIRQLLSKPNAPEHLEAKVEKINNESHKVPIGYRCNFCVEVHPTLRAICNHLRKHVQYGEVKAGHMKELIEDTLTIPGESVMNLNVANGAGKDPGLVETSIAVAPVHIPSPNVAAAPVGSGQEPGGVAEGRPRLGSTHSCSQCGRVFMSTQGLRSHERSHSATALFSRDDKYSCQYCQFASPFRHNLDRHIQSHHGHHKPFRCKLCPFKSAYLSRLKNHLHKTHGGENTYKCLSCPFSTMTISQLKEHSLKAHGETLTLPKLRAATHAALRNTRLTQNSDQPLPVPESQEPTYLELPDVQQQLSHHQLGSHNQATSSPPLSLGMEPRLDGVLTCEFCDFSSGYMQSLRRHYRDRHGGKKLFKCKDCSFFTCHKSTLIVHVEAGHTTVHEDNPQELHCPLCPYHTEHKSNMIDHIVLHSDERIVPLEVSHSSPSCHLQGVVFRCHECTFSCSNDEALQLHVCEHGERKPYTCQLCYYDSRQRLDLEAHLRDKHKVIRNFELVGRVNLDQLEAMREKPSSLSSAEEEGDLEEEEEGHGSEDVEETEQPEPDAPTSPSSRMSGSDGRRISCEFCGRTFTHSAEWERHVLRHGMTVASVKKEDSPTQISASESEMCSTDMVVHSDGNLPVAAKSAECGYPLDLARREVIKMEDNETPQTKNNP
ncbi:zinc finger protein 462 isoform X2 [Scleropages formosus]|uniref:zinc finger protein 462 isoform X2 n=1 Tax=Scleropages formosus TaxID=113540 RepID=UPI000878470E|nr:zinc finger protein 462-like isoform X2 [Scleropages formosus]